ncbi:MAG: ATPase P [Desulfobacterales bacterium]|jgi:soluble P-type ATPase|nr:ATPase P [Desulfobacterales bacterium]
MIEIDIPGYKKLTLTHLVLDFNGTLACDGIMIPGVAERLNALSEKLKIVVLTADTFGKAAAELASVNCKLTILPLADQDKGKLAVVQQLGSEQTACIGNGRNDNLMLRAAGLGIAVILEEGVAQVTLASADVVCTGILSALDLLSHPLRLVATLRS